MSYIDEVCGYEGQEPPQKPRNYNQWIPVGERLPDRRWDGFSDIVVVAAGNSYFLGRYYRSDTAEHCSRCGASVGELWYIGTTAEPTHWMPLPEPPEVK